MASLSDAQYKTLLGNEWFAQFSTHIQQDIINHAHLIQLQPGDCLFNRGDQGDGWYAVLSGSIKISGTSRQGRAAVLTFLGPGHWTGELSLLDGGPRSHDAYAHTHSQLLKISPAQFNNLIDTHSVLVKQLLLKRCKVTRALMEGLEASTIFTVEQRLANTLLTLANSFGSSASNGIKIDLHLSQELLAQLMGVSRPRINQLINHWQNQQFIKHDYGTLTILDYQSLEELARG